MLKIDHIAIWVFDLEKQKSFYETYFQCQSNQKYYNPVKGFTSYFLTFEDQTRIELMKSDFVTGKQVSSILGYCHVAFRLQNREQVDFLTARMLQNGITVECPPRVTGDGYYESVILDPEQNRIELVAY